MLLQKVCGNVKHIPLIGFARIYKKLLQGTPATIASVECGFRDYSTFSRAYKKQLGYLPSESDAENF